MMIHDALRCPDASEKSLWTMDIDNSVHLHNFNPHISSGMSPEEIWTRSKSSNIALHNDHPWGCPAYVLEPRLQDGKNFQSGCQGLGEINIWEPLLCITAQLDWSGTHKLATLALIFIRYLVTILRLCMQ